MTVKLAWRYVGVGAGECERDMAIFGVPEVLCDVALHTHANTLLFS